MHAQSGGAFPFSAASYSIESESIVVPPRDRERGSHGATQLLAKQTVQNMTEGSPVSLILRFALPIFISQVFQQLYSTADAFIVGKYLGTNAFAAVSSSGTLIMLLTSLFIGTAMGAGVAISKYFGAGDYENVSRAIHTNLAFGIVSGAIADGHRRFPHADVPRLDEYRRAGHAAGGRILPLLLPRRAGNGALQYVHEHS